MSLTDESIVLDSLEGCARCGGTHARLRFFKMEQPMVLTSRDGGYTFTHWALCPSRREPVMMNAALLDAAITDTTKGA